jgi:hypothetical protein
MLCPKDSQGGTHVYDGKDLKVVPGKGKEGASKKSKKVGKNAEMNAGNNGNETSVLFKNRSIFWNLPYLKDLMVHHAIDFMNVEKNVCEADQFLAGYTQHNQRYT